MLPLPFPKWIDPRERVAVRFSPSGELDRGIGRNGWEDIFMASTLVEFTSR